MARPKAARLSQYQTDSTRPPRPQRSPPPALGCHAPQDRQQEEARRERVLALGNPRDGFDVHGMHDENHRGQEGARNPEPAQDGPEEQRIADVQKHIGEVVAGRIHAPQAPFQPERTIGERPIVHWHRRRTRSSTARPRLHQAVFGQQRIVVPQESAAKRGPVHRERDCDQQRGRGRNSPAGQGTGRTRTTGAVALSRIVSGHAAGERLVLPTPGASAGRPRIGHTRNYRTAARPTTSWTLSVTRNREFAWRCERDLGDVTAGLQFAALGRH